MGAEEAAVPLRTHKDGTECAHGFVPHYRGRYPVKIMRQVRQLLDGSVHYAAVTHRGYPIAVRDASGCYIYATPGGREFTP